VFPFLPAGDCLISRDLVEQLPHGTLGLENRAAMVHNPRQICIGKRKRPKGQPQHFARANFPSLPKKKPGCGLR
jgi:hypothetical protein